MAWTVISDATLEVGKALRALTVRNLRDNISAVANGEAGAPQIQTAAIATGAVTTAKIAVGNVTTDRIAAGNVTTDRIATGAVAAWNASLGTGEIGTYAFLSNRQSGRVTEPGGNYAGSFRYCNNSATDLNATDVGGTWKCMGRTTGLNIATVFLRIA